MNQLEIKKTPEEIIKKMEQTINDFDICSLMALLTANFWDKVVNQLKIIEKESSKDDNCYQDYASKTISAIRNMLKKYEQPNFYE